MKSEKTIIKEIKNSFQGIKECEMPDNYIYQGWVEALEWVLGKEIVNWNEIED